MGRRSGCLALVLAAGLSAVGCADRVTASSSPGPLQTVNNVLGLDPNHDPSVNTDKDPDLVKLQVLPLESSGPVRTRQLLIATVYDRQGKPCRNRWVRWTLEGVGQILEVDETGTLGNAGRRVDDHYAYSTTAFWDHRLEGKTSVPGQVAAIQPGQTWCVIGSSEEGVSKLTVYAPQVTWETGKVVVYRHWIDAACKFPTSAVATAGTRMTLTTALARSGQGGPLPGYRVRYHVIDGPTAAFPGGKSEVVVSSDAAGNATTTLLQPVPHPGTNHVGVEVLRAGTGGDVVVSQSQIAAEWENTSASLTQGGPALAAVGQDLTFTITVTNAGKGPVKYTTLRGHIPNGVTFVRSEPAANVDGGDLIWTLGETPGGGKQAVQLVFHAVKTGPVTNCVSMTTDEGQTEQACYTTQVSAPGLKLAVTGPETAAVGVPVACQVTVSNPGGVAATRVMLHADLDSGLEHSSKAPAVEVSLPALPAGQSHAETLYLTPRQSGRLAARISASADGGLAEKAEHAVTARDTRLDVKLTGPAWSLADRPAEWTLLVSNPGEVPFENVEVRDYLPRELIFQQASDDGRVESPGVIVWTLPTLKPGEKKALHLKATCAVVTPRTVQRAVVASGSTTARDEMPVEVRGIPAYRLLVRDDVDPVPLNGVTTYRIEVFNPGTADARGVQVTAEVPPELRVLGASGPARWRMESGNVVFEARDGLMPKQVFAYAIQVQAVKAGSAVLRVQLRGATLTKPVVVEESTQVYGAPPALTPRSEAAAVPTSSTGVNTAGGQTAEPKLAPGQ
jgi:uncharacterized repeat protein (TIGR01451 family)